MKIDLSQNLRQEQRLTPQMVQSMELLQMNTQELLDYLARAVEENPVLEREEPGRLWAEYEQLRSRNSWLDMHAAGQEERPEAGSTDWEVEGLSAFLYDQLERLTLDKRMLALCTYIAQLLDEDGYLLQEDLGSLIELKVPGEMIDKALSIVQSLEPAGVGARDLAECLTLQLLRQGERDETVLAIVREHLGSVSRRHYGAIARALNVTEKEVSAAAERIAALEPHPGRAFQTGERTVYLRPDVFIVETEGTYEVVLNEYYLPRLNINPYYAQLLQQPPDEETAAYLRQKMRSAKCLLYSLDQRGTTLRRCAETALRRQMCFFNGSSRELRPMSLRQLAQELQVHPSTVTRALRGKYLQCRQGTYPLRYFFPLPAGGVSRQAVQQKLLELIRQEDRSHPLSDEQLCSALAQQGVEISRRTVAKYRGELGLPGAAVRRKKQ